MFMRFTLEYGMERLYFGLRRNVLDYGEVESGNLARYLSCNGMRI